MQIDCYGFEATSQFFRRKELAAHLMKRIDGVLYVCFGGESERPIHRLDKDEHGSVRLMWAYGKWDEAESLRYIPINQTMEIKGVQRDIASHYACNDRCYKRYGDPALPRHGHLVRYTRYCSHSAISSSKDIPHVRELQAKKKQI